MKKIKVLFSAPVLTISGYGVHSRMIADALMQRDDVDLYVRALRWGETPFLYADDPVKYKYMELIDKFNGQPEQQYDISVQVTIPSEFDPRFANYNVGITAGVEVDRITPEWIDACNKMDQIIVPSEFTKAVMQGTAYKKDDQDRFIMSIMETIFEGIDTSIYNPDHCNKEFKKVLDKSIDTPFNFLFVGQWGKGGYSEDRKNIHKLVYLFCKEFEGKKDVGLILKTNIYGNHPLDKTYATERLASILLGARQGEYPRIHLIHGYLSNEEMATLYNYDKVKGFVSLHHGEGYGLTLAQAAMCDVPIMATDWSAPKDFLDEGNWIKLPYDMQPIPQSFVWKGVAEPGAQWAEVRDTDVVNALRRFYDKPAKPKQNAIALGLKVREKFSLEAFFKVFNNSFDDILKRYEQRMPDKIVQNINSAVDKTPSIGYVMPRHAGDVLNSTIVVGALKKKYPDHYIYFITSEEYRDVVEGNEDIYKVISYTPHIHDNLDMMKEIFDYYFTPHFDVQYTFSNWIHKHNKINIVDKFLQHCGLSKEDVQYEEAKVLREGVDDLEDLIGHSGKYVVFHPADDERQGARQYKYWQLVIDNVQRLLPNHKMVVVGNRPNELEFKGVVDLRGKTLYRALGDVIFNADCVVGIDSLPMHMACAMDTPCVSLFGSSHPECTGPYMSLDKCVMLEPPNRMSCTKACYKNGCYLNPNDPCINMIDPKDVFNAIKGLFITTTQDMDQSVEFTKTYPKISAYVTTYNCKEAGIPFEQSINSALLFADEVVVVDGVSTDGTREALDAMSAQDDRITVHDKEWDFNEPGIDGEMKTYAKIICSHPILWQFDADEIMHEDDVLKIKELAYRMQNSKTDIVSLPVVELWGDELHATGRRHCWKWRMYKNDFNVVHGIPSHDRVLDEKTGQVYSSGKSDGCFPVNSMDFEMMPDSSFYRDNPAMEKARIENHELYAKYVNQAINELPSVWHTSWMSLPNKIQQFKRFWAKQWSLLYKKDPTNRFFIDKPVDYEPSQQEVDEIVNKMKEQGAEDMDEIKFKFKVDKEAPKFLKELI